jgi:long-chain acyl-CoA synthetase
MDYRMAQPSPLPAVGPDDLLLARALHWARTSPDRTWLFQPVGGGVVEEYSWARALDESRRLAAWLRTFDFPPGSSIAMLAKNSAHFVIFELAIWMAGHVTVAIYPTLTAHSVEQILEHSDARLLFVGKLDGWSSMKAGVPATLPTMACALSPTDARERFPLWESIITQHAPIADTPTVSPDARAVIMYTSGSTGTPKGVMHSHRTMAVPPIGYAKEFSLGPQHRLFSYLPLSHTLERTLVMATSIRHGASMYFNQSLETLSTATSRRRAPHSSSRFHDSGCASRRRSSRSSPPRSWPACSGSRSCVASSARRCCSSSASTRCRSPSPPRRRCPPMSSGGIRISG